MQRKWWQDAVIYQIYMRSFMDSNGDGIGDLPGVLERLDYLKWLGVDALWLSPIHPSPDDDNGYDVSDYRDVHPDFGTLADFDRLLAEAHRRGMRILLDLVPNHTSDVHPWFQESRSSRDNPKRAWYIWRDGKPDGSPPNNWASIFRGPAWQYDATTGQYFLHLFTARQPDLNWENPAVRRAICELSTWWLERGVDGFRIDAITHLKKTPGLPDMPNPEGLPYLPAYPYNLNVDGVLDYVDELSREVFERHDIVTIGEANGVSAEQGEDWVGFARHRLSMIVHFDHWQLWSADPGAGLNVRELKHIFGRWQTALDGRGWNALYLENHDLPRVLSRWGDPAHHREASATALATVYFLQQGTPVIYQGQELGMGNTRFRGIEDFQDTYAHNHIEEQRARGYSDAAIFAELSLTSRDNSRTPMPWSDGPGAGFTTGSPWLRLNPEYPEVNVARAQADPASVLHYYRRLIELRRAERVLREGHFRLLQEEDPQVFAYLRELPGETPILVLANLGGSCARYAGEKDLIRHAALLLANHPVAPHPDGTECLLQPYEARIYRLSA